MSSTLIERIDEALEEAGLTDEAACKKAGIHRDTIRDLRRGKRASLTGGTLTKLANALGKSETWLLSRKDQGPGALTYERDDVAGAAMAEGGRRRGVPRDEIAHVSATAGLGVTGEAQTISFVENGVTIGALPVQGSWKLPESVVRARFRTSLNHVHVVECEGRSMEPAIMDGDFVFIDETRRNPQMPGIFALWEGDGVTVKNVEMIVGSDPPKVRLIPENKTFSPYERLAEEVHIIGRYIGRFTVR